MLPQNNGLSNIETEDNQIMPSKTYRLDLKNKRIQGYDDGLEALKQAVYKILNTERYKYPIYSFNYGIELEELVGKDILFVKADLKRRIEEALLQDDRITRVENFKLEHSDDEIKAYFEVISNLGNISIERVVSL